MLNRHGIITTFSYRSNMTNESDCSSDYDSDASSDEMELGITKTMADQNYILAGTLVEEPSDEISLVKHRQLLHDTVDIVIRSVLFEEKVSFKLADFQMLSLHVLGSLKDLILVSPTGSGKMLGKYIISSFGYKSQCINTNFMTKSRA